MKILYLMRHAKSSWAESNLADFDRPLNDRGQKTAPFMGSVMRKNGYMPDIIISSPAVRASSTARLVKEAANIVGELQFDKRIYEAIPQTLNEVAASIDDKYDAAMLVGHNPGIEGFIRFLTGDIESMPTTALAAIELNIEAWDKIGAKTGRVVKVIRPKDELKSLGTSS
jgi:Phosphohistidine phosphatase SixA